MKWRNILRQFLHEGPLLDFYRFTSPLPKTKLRLYEEADFDTCSELYRLNETNRFPANHLPHYQEHLREDNSLILVIEESGRVVGTGGIMLDRCTDDLACATLNYGLIHPDAQGRGYGTLIFCARVAYLSASRDWNVFMTSAGNGTEDYYKNLGFIYLSDFEDEDSSTLQFYFVKVLGIDIVKFHKMITQSGSAALLDFNQPIPERDRREEYQEQLKKAEAAQ